MENKETTKDADEALAEASVPGGASQDETFWQRLMREFNEFIWPEEKP